MVKVQIEIDDELAERLSYDLSSDKRDPTNLEVVARNVLAVLRRYSDFPKVLDDKHRAALVILRSQAMAQSIQCTKPGEGAWAEAAG